MPTPSNAVLVKLTHQKFGQLIVDEKTVADYRKKGWSVDGEESAPEAEVVEVTASSTDVTVKQAAEVISGLNSVEDVKAYVDAEKRNGVIKAAQSRADELETDPE